MGSKRHKKKKKNKKHLYSREEIKFIQKIAGIKLIYLDNALLGFKTDEARKKTCGENFLQWVKKEKKETIISYVNIYELRPLFFGKIKKSKPELGRTIFKTLKDFKPDLILEEDTLKLLKNYKKLGKDFFMDKLKVGEADAAHFVLALISNVDLFVSFNKRAFKNKKKSIANEIIKYGLKMPEIWDLNDIEENLSKYDKLISPS